LIRKRAGEEAEKLKLKVTSMNEERIYTIPLRKMISSPRTYRARKAINLIEVFLERHLKAPRDKIKIGQSVNEAVWANGIKHPPSKVKVSVIMEDDVFKAELVGFKAKEPEKKEEPKKEEPKTEEPKKEKVKKEKSDVETGKKEEKPEKVKEETKPKKKAEGTNEVKEEEPEKKKEKTKKAEKSN